MTISLVGEVVNDCDTANFSPGDIGDGDIISKQGTQYIGLKVSNGTNTFITTTLGATAPYDFSVGGGEENYHIIMFFIGLTAVNTSTGFRVYLGDTVGSDNGFYAFPPPAQYSGGWVSRVVNPVIDFTGATGFTTTGNPAQLTNINEIGGGFTTITMIAGNFQNVCIDQITIGLGVRADAGTIGTPNTFETIRAGDEGTSGNVWGWVGSSAGTIIVKGGIFLGPATGTATSVFNDSNRVLLFADEPVADDFYKIELRGVNTDVDFTSCIIRCEDPVGNANTRWDLTLDATSIPILNDSGSLFGGFGVITLQTGSTLDGTSLDDGTSLIQNNATLTNCIILNANTADGVAFITADNLGNISNCSFTFSDGHAIEIDTIGTYDFDANILTGYGLDATNDAAIYNNSGGLVTINVLNSGTTPTIRNGAGASTVVNNAVTVAVAGLSEGSSVQVLANETAGTRTVGDVLGEGLADSNGDFSFGIDFEGAFGAGLDVIARCRNQGFPTAGISATSGGTVFADETEANNNSTIDDITLLPDPTSTNDAYYWGHGEKFNQLKLEVSQAGDSGYATLTWEYWNGASWASLSSISDGTNNYENLGRNTVSWSDPSGWATTTVNSQGPFYYVRARQNSLSVGLSQPLGRKVKLDVTRYIPFTQNNTIESSGLNVVAVWIEDTISTF